MDRPDDPPDGWHTKADDHLDDRPDARWMTFEELAKARGISKLSAAALVRRHRWRRQRDNRGRVIALVPNDGPELRRAPDHLPDRLPNRPYLPDHPPPHQPDNPPYAAFETALAAIETAHAREIHALRERADAAQATADRALAQLAETEKRAGAERSRADRAEQAVAGERSRADELRERLGLTVDELRQAREAADQARQHAREAEDAIEGLRRSDAERRVRGRWSRAWDGWRGR
jgi:hypothetical protein